MALVIKERRDQLTHKELTVLDLIIANPGIKHRGLLDGTPYTSGSISGTIVALMHYGFVVRAYPSPCTYWATQKGMQL